MTAGRKAGRYLVRCAQRGVGKFLPGDGRRIHQAALGDGEYRHALIVVAARSGVVLGAAGARAGAVGRRAGVGSSGDGHDARIGSEFKAAGLELIQRTFVLEENDLAVGFAAGLESDAQLSHLRIAHMVAVHVDVALAESAADAQRARTHRGEYGISVAVAEECRTGAGILED